MRWLAVLVMVGCIEPQLQPCGDLLCAPDAVCLSSGLCASKEAVDVCVGLEPGATCTTVLFTGSCVDGACAPTVCGDGIIGGSEQCDGPVSGLDCVDYGFDLGVPTCTERCGLDLIGGCEQF